MALVKTYDEAYELQELFREWDRDNYSLEGYQAIINYFNEIGDNVELDVVAICCDFNEASVEDIKSNYSNISEIAEAEDDDELLDALNYYTYAIKLDNDNILYTSF